MKPTQTTEFAPAKVNLTLHVTGQRDDGYHLLDSLVVFCGIGDTVSVASAPTLSLTITGSRSGDLTAGDDNLVLRAARLFRADGGAAITLTKRLPVASGIGGGSADAAATLRALSKMWDMPLPDHGQLLALGADLPVCLLRRAARMRGIGDKVDVVASLPEMHIVLVNPNVQVPTPLIFKHLKNKNNTAMPDAFPKWRDASDLALWLSTQRNDLQEPARSVAPVISDVLGVLAHQPGALIARMSGSGATCFALFATADAAMIAATRIGAEQRGWWAASGPVLQASDRNSP